MADAFESGGSGAKRKTTMEPSSEEGGRGGSMMADAFESGGSGTEPSLSSESGEGDEAS